MTVPTRAEIDAMLRDRLANDPKFRDRLLADPRTALSGLIGVEIPDTIAVIVHEESLTDVHLVIPAEPETELGIDDLELVAGGVCWANTCGSSCTI